MAKIQYVNKVVDVLASAARAAGVAQASTVLDVEDFREATLWVDLTAIGGTPDTTALDVKLQWSPDSSGEKWVDVTSGSVQQMTGVDSELIAAKEIIQAKRLRALYTLAFTNGTNPTATFQVSIGLTKF